MSAPSRDDIAAWALDGSLVERASTPRGFGGLAENREAARIASDLANQGRIDLLSLFEAEPIASCQKHGLFRVQRFFCDALPGLNAPVEAVVAIVDRLVTTAGTDLAAGLPNSALVQWIREAPARAREVVDGALRGDDLYRRHLTFALEAGGYVDQARRLAEDDERELRLSAITALGRMAHDEVALAQTLSVFDRVLAKGADDVDRANILVAAFQLIFAAGRPPAAAAEANFIARVLDGGGDQTRHQLASGLWFQAGMAEEPLLSTALTALRVVSPEHNGTLQQLDLALQGLIERGKGEEVIRFLVDLAGTAPDLDLNETFDNFFHSLLADPVLLPSATVKFLLSGHRNVSDALAHQLSVNRRDEPLTLPAPILAGIDRRLLSRKISGYFFLLPVPATALLVSIIESSDTAEAVHVAHHLYRWFLVNYHAARTHLAKVKPVSKVAKRFVGELKRAQKAYLANLDTVAPVRELAPSERHREVERVKAEEMAVSIRKGAEEKSVFFDLVKRSVLLYGTGSISYVSERDGTLRPISMELKPMGVSWEMPLLDRLDPLGMGYQLEVFRAEAVQ